MNICSYKFKEISEACWKQNFWEVIHPIYWLFFVKVSLGYNIIVEEHHRTKVNFVIRLIHKRENFGVKLYKRPTNCKNIFLFFFGIFDFHQVINKLRIFFSFRIVECVYLAFRYFNFSFLNLIVLVYLIIFIFLCILNHLKIYIWYFFTIWKCSCNA